MDKLEWIKCYFCTYGYQKQIIIIMKKLNEFRLKINKEDNVCNFHVKF